MAKIKDTIEDEKEFRDKELEAIEPKGYFFNKARHIHTLDGENLNGITTILGIIAKPALIQWSANMACDYILDNLRSMGEIDEVVKLARTAHRKKKEKAGDIGTAVHEAVEAFIKNGVKVAPTASAEPTENEKIIQKCLDNFIEFTRGYKVKFLESEKNLYSREYWLGGIVDFVCEIDGEIWIGDVKTASGIYPENFLQMAGYQLMLEEMGLYNNVKGHIVVNLRKDGEIEVKQNCEIETHKEAFLSALTLYRCLNDAK